MGWTAPFKQPEEENDQAAPTGKEVRLLAAMIRIFSHDKKRFSSKVPLKKLKLGPYSSSTLYLQLNKNFNCILHQLTVIIIIVLLIFVATVI